MAELLRESKKTLSRTAFLSEIIGPVSNGPVQGVLIGIPKNLPNVQDGSSIMYIVSIPSTVMGLVIYDGRVTMEERAGGNILHTDLF